MAAYYNEHDPKAAAWLRELVRQGHIAPGEVDERSILDVQADDLRGFAQCHFFAGIGVWSHALRRAGWGDARPVWTGSCPCQPFSAAGKRGGTDDERHLWPVLFGLVRECRPPVLLGEQVSSRDGLAWFDAVSADLEGSDYAVGALDTCAAGVGAPHIRQRLYFGARDLWADQPAGGRLERLRDQPAHGVVVPAGSGSLGLADALHDGPWQHRDSVGGAARADEGEAGERQWVRSDLADGVAACRLADPDGRDARAERQQRGGEHGLIEEDSRVVGVADPDCAGSGGLAPAWLHGRRAGASSGGASEGDPDGALRHDADGRGAHGGPRPTDGFWRDADWLLCRDGLWRPVEPGSFPLAHGAPARVGRLRGYGNALVAEQAVAFIEAFDGALTDTRAA